MRTMTASTVSRNFSSVLDLAEQGETIVVTRGGRRLAIISPAPRVAGRAVKEALAPLTGSLDDDFEGDIASARELLTLPEDPWNE